MRLSTSNKGWHSQWFYLKNDTAAPLSEFNGRLIEEAPEPWRKWRVSETDKKKIQDHITAIHILKENGPKGSRVIRAYHARRVAPLMMRVLPLYMMVPGASFDGMTLAEGALPHSEVAQCIKEVMEPSWDDAGAPLNFVYPVLGHPPMRPEPGHVVFVSLPFSCLLFNRFSNLLILTLRGARPAKGPHFMDRSAPLLRDSSMRAVNHAQGERLRKAKEDKRKKS